MRSPMRSLQGLGSWSVPEHRQGGVALEFVDQPLVAVDSTTTAKKRLSSSTTWIGGSVLTNRVEPTMSMKSAATWRSSPENGMVLLGGGCDVASGRDVRTGRGRVRVPEGRPPSS